MIMIMGLLLFSKVSYFFVPQNQIYALQQFFSMDAQVILSLEMWTKLRH